MTTASYGGRFLLPVRAAPRLRTASPAEVDGPLHREGPVSSVNKRSQLQESMSGAVGSDEEDSMDQIILCAIAMVALGWWGSIAPWRTAVAMRRQDGLGRIRLREGAVA